MNEKDKQIEKLDLINKSIELMNEPEELPNEDINTWEGCFEHNTSITFSLTFKNLEKANNTTATINEQLIKFNANLIRDLEPFTKKSDLFEKITRMNKRNETK